VPITPQSLMNMASKPCCTTLLCLCAAATVAVQVSIKAARVVPLTVVAS